jgi:hypothetical protein
VIGFSPSFSLVSEIVLNEGSERFDLTAHILADGLQILVREERLDTLQNV